MSRFFLIFSCIGLYCLPATVFAQKQACIWYFGQYAGLDFNSGSPVALIDGALEIGGGSSSIADENGKLLFYTDGWNVWNRKHERMPGNGYRLNGGGDNSGNSGFIAPRPGNATEYYIFTTDAPPPFGQYGLQYSIVDMKAAGGLGDVSVKNIPMLDSVCPKIAITRHANGRDLWVVTQHMDTNAFYAFIVTDTGVSHNPVISYVGMSPKTAFMSSRGGQIKFSPDGTKLATAMGKSVDQFELIQFDRSTGKLSSPVLSSTFALPTGIYGIEFSPDNSKLYTSIRQSGMLIQYDISIHSTAAILLSQTVIYQGQYCGALQLGSDGKIYVCHGENEQSISSIDNPNAKGKDCQYSHHSVYLGGKTTNSCFPSFLTSYFRKPDITHYRTCVGDTTFFTLLQDAAIDSVYWDFGDPVTGGENTAFTKAASHVFSTPGTYTVRLRAYSGWVSDVVEHTVTIAPLPVVDLGTDREVCAGTEVLLSAGEGGISYLWSTGDTTSTITARASGEYWVVKRHGICEERDSVRLMFVIPELTLAQDTLICEGGSVQLQAPEAVSYLWEPSDGLSANDVANPVASPASSTTYTVTIQGPDGCLRQGRVVVRVLPQNLCTVRVADTVAVSSMEEVFLPVRIEIPASWLPLRLHSLQADIRFRSDAFDAVGTTAGSSTMERTGEEMVLHIALNDLDLTETSQLIVSLRGRVLLGKDLSSSFVVENVRINDCLQERTASSWLSLDSSQMCAISMRPIRKLVKPEIILSPHPVTAESVIGIRSTETGLHRIVIQDMRGENVLDDYWEGTPSGTYELLAGQKLSSGVYTLILYSPSGIIHQSFVVTR